MPQKLIPADFEPNFTTQQVDAKSETPITTVFELFAIHPTLTTQPLKSYLVSRLTLLNLENQIYQAFWMPAVLINLNPYQGLKQLLG